MCSSMTAILTRRCHRLTAFHQRRKVDKVIRDEAYLAAIYERFHDQLEAV